MKRKHTVSCPTGSRTVVLTREANALVVNVNAIQAGTVGKTSRASKKATPWMAVSYVAAEDRPTYHKTALAAVRRVVCSGR